MRTEEKPFEYEFNLAPKHKVHTKDESKNQSTWWLTHSNVPVSEMKER